MIGRTGVQNKVHVSSILLMSHHYNRDPTHTFMYGETGEPQYSPHLSPSPSPSVSHPYSPTVHLLSSSLLHPHHQWPHPKREQLSCCVTPGHVLLKLVESVPRFFHISMSLQSFPSRGIESENPWFKSRLHSSLLCKLGQVT